MRNKLAGFAVLMVVLAARRGDARSAKPTSNGRQYFVSLGDSYAVGFQSDVGHTTLNGPANQLVKLAAKPVTGSSSSTSAAAARRRRRC